MIAPARVAAYEILSAVANGRADLPSAIAHSRGTLADDRDRALASEIATGVQRWRAALDFLIAHFAKRTLDRLDPQVVDILRLSLYQLLHLTRVPAAAVVDDAVSLTKRVKKRSAAGFVNGVLRSLSRSRGDLPLPPRPPTFADRDATLDYFAVTLSHPRWLAERWLVRYGGEHTETWMRFNNAPAPLTLRANGLAQTRDQLRAALLTEGVETEPGRFAPDALIVTGGHPLRHGGDGRFVIQDEASQLVALGAGPNPGPRVLDACASPGGKTTAIAAMMQGRGQIVACDVRPKRMDLLRQTVEMSGATNVTLMQADLLAPLPFTEPFDTVIVDAPCSGLGTLRRDPDIKWRRREDELPSLAAAQLVMLQRAADVVSPGGRLLYATCSSEPEENDGVARAFLATAGEFEMEPARLDNPLMPSDVVDENGCLRTLPHVHGLEAFFGAFFRRRR